MNPQFTYISQHFDAVIWDFDGVIIDSDLVREEGFRYALRHYDIPSVNHLIDYHKKNGGFSRYVKFSYFFEKISGMSEYKKELAWALDDFSDFVTSRLISKDRLIKSNIEGIEFLKGYDIIQLLVSASDQNELRELTKELEIACLFSDILGSPTPKVENVANLIDHFGLNKSRTLLP